MSEREAFLRAICTNPDDDTPRLVFADWLQENGDEARAEFIRVQVEAEHYPLSRVARKRYFLRERELLEEYEPQWRSGLPNTFYGEPFIRGFVESARVGTPLVSAQETESLFEMTPLIDLTCQVTDPGLLADVPVLSRLRHLTLYFSNPSSESIERFIHATNLTNLVSLKILAFDFPRHPMAGRLRARFKGVLREGG